MNIQLESVVKVSRRALILSHNCVILFKYHQKVLIVRLNFHQTADSDD